MGHWGNILLNPLYQSRGDGGITYLLNDEFTTDRAAGAVNGTAAEPGPGTRNITDLDNRISITGGVLNIAANAGGTSGFGRTGIWYTPAITRLPGLVIAQTVQYTAGMIAIGGLTTTASASNVGYNNLGYGFASTPLFSARKTTDGSSPTVMTPATSTAYRIYTVLRATGRFLFVKSAGVTKLLWFDAWDGTATLYAGFTDWGRTDAVTIDDVLISQSQVYSVLALASDSFNRANGVLGSTDGVGHAEANSGSGKAWTAQTGTWGVATNKAACSVLTGSGIATVDAGAADVVLAVDVTRSAGNVGFVLRYASATNYIYGYYDGTNVTLRKVVNGSDSQVLAPTAITGSKFLVTADGTKFRLFFEDLHRGAELTISDATLQAGTNHGLYTSDTGATFDNFVVFKRNGWDDLGAF